MKRLFALGLCAVALAGCQTTGADNTAPTCPGKHRRPMNIYPSVLPNTAVVIPAPSASAPAPEAQAAASTETPAPAAPQAVDPTVYPSCE